MAEGIIRWVGIFVLVIMLTIGTYFFARYFVKWPWVERPVAVVTPQRLVTETPPTPSIAPKPVPTVPAEAAVWTFYKFVGEEPVYKWRENLYKLPKKPNPTSTVCVRHDKIGWCD